MRPPAEIDCGDRQRFVHRHHEVAGAVDAAAVAERLRHGLAERDADVLDRVMLIDVEVARCAQLEIEAAVTREQLEHVIEKPDAGADVVTALAVERQRQRDLRLGRDTFDGGAPHTSHSSAVMNFRVCSHDARGDPQTAATSRIARAIANMNAAGGECRLHVGAPSFESCKHEIGFAFPVGHSGLLSARRRAAASFVHLAQIPVAVRHVRETLPRQRHGRANVQAVG